MENLDLVKILEFMVSLAKKAGKIQMENYGKPYKTDWEQQHMRTEIDKKIGIMTRKEINKKYPDFSIFSEELPEQLGNNWIFVIDEIDGTNPYFRQFSDHFCFSIGLYIGKRPIAGVVFAPKRNEMYVGSEYGAFCNSKPIKVSRTHDINKVWMEISPGKHNRTKHIPYLERAYSDNGICASVHFGSFASSCILVACGKLDAFLATSPEPEDVAGSVPILSAAGAKVTNLKGEPWQLGDPIFVANPVLHKKLFDFLNL